MEVSEMKKTNKCVLLVTYCIAVVCLLAGLFVPLYNGDKILALQLPDLLKNIVVHGAENAPFTNVIGLSDEAYLNFTALVLILYFAITAVALIALVPIGICFRKNTKADRIIAYTVETAAVIVLSLHIIFALSAISNYPPVISFRPEPITFIGYNMIIALGGTLLMLIILSIANKKSTGVAKLFLFLLSAVALLVIFDLAMIIPGLDSLGESFPLALSLFKDGLNVNGIYLIDSLFFNDFGGMLAELTEAKFKAAYVLGTIVGLAVLINYFIDVISLSSNAKGKGLLFNLIRYGVELAAAVCLIITVAVCGFGMGLFLVIIAAVALLRLAISLVRFLLARKRAKAAKEVEDNSPMFARPSKPPKQRADDDHAADIIVDVPDVTSEEIPFVGAEPIESAKPIVTDEKVPEETAEQIAFIEPVPEPVPVEEPAEEPLTVNPDEVQMEIEGTSPEETFTEPVWGPVWDSAPEEKSEPAFIQPEVDEAPAEETPAEPVWEPEPASPQPAHLWEPARAEVPEPVKAEPAPEPVAPQPAPVWEPEPVKTEPAVPQPTPVPEPAPEPVKPQPAPVTETKSEPQRAYSPVRYTYGPDGELIYTIRYGGPSDEFIDKLTNDEKIEFAMTFIEKSKGDVGNIPEYVIGGNNKKFFSAVFIYLGRIRGMISDGLLNKMFKELNML